MLKAKSQKLQDLSEGPDLEVSPSGAVFTLSIGATSISINRATAEDIALLLEDALLRTRAEDFFSRVSN